MKTMMTSLFCVLLAGMVNAENRQQRILAEAPAAGRFTIKDRDWPTQPGEASICLWKDDALAALSITVDDNWAADHPWWLEMGQKYGLRVTWFVISGRVSGSNPFNGTWAGFRKLLDAGHDVQSHSVTHLHTEEPGWKDVEWEYAESAKQIEAGLPGHRAVALAYPGGKNSNLNDPAIAAKYYIGCRGATGSVNPANKINYLRTNSLGGVPNIGTAQWESQDLLSALESGRAKNKDLYRAWYCCHFHGVDKPEVRAAVEKSFAFVSEKTKAGELWPGLFADVIRYGQERDTARLEVRKATPQQVVLAVADDMDDTLFDYPLTVKLRLAWPSAQATQNGKAAACRVIEHAGAKFALVDVVPDRGEVVIVSKNQEVNGRPVKEVTLGQ
jgi:Polysaccharide deacetylase